MTKKEHIYKTKLIAEAHLKKPQQKDDPTITWKQRYTAYRSFDSTAQAIYRLNSAMYNFGYSTKEFGKAIKKLQEEN